MPDAIELTPEEARLLMEIIYDSDNDGAAELHDTLVELGVNRIEAGKSLLIQIK